MKMYKLILSISLFILVSFTTIAQTAETAPQETTPQETTPQETPKPSLDNGTIKSQFDYMMKKSSRYQEYKVVKLEWLNKFESNIQDTLKLVKSNLNDSKSLIGKQNNEISSLKTELQNLKNELEETVRSKNSLKFLGIELEKSTYNTIMWVLILVSLAVAGVCFMLFKRSNVITVETKATLEEVREEFDTHRKNALVREQKLARKLQDEVIKNKNLGL